jgi:hypothetical protein
MVALVEFAGSQEGSYLYLQVVAELRETLTADQMVLNLKTLLALELFRRTPYEAGPASECYLEDFIHLLDGDVAANRRATLAQMLMSCGSETHRQDALGFILSVNGEAPPPHDLDWVSSNFWGYRLDQGLDTSCTLWKTRLKLIELSKASGRQCLRSGENPDWEMLDSTEAFDSPAKRDSHSRGGSNTEHTPATI